MAAPDRNLALELVRVTEAAALAASRWVGKGDKNGADGAAVDAMRAVLASVPMDGVVVIGEGEKDEAPMLYNGERVGNGEGPGVDVAVDPIDGTRLTSVGQPNALSVIALSERGTMFFPGAAVYMEKVAAGPEAANAIDVTAPPEENVRLVAKAKSKKVEEVSVMVLDRPRHEPIIQAVREVGARVFLITDGDVAGAISAAAPRTGVDLLIGIGGTPEGVVAAFVRTSVQTGSPLDRAIIAASRLAQTGHAEASDALRRVRELWEEALRPHTRDETALQLVLLVSDGLYFNSALATGALPGPLPRGAELDALIALVERAAR